MKRSTYLVLLALVLFAPAASCPGFLTAIGILDQLLGAAGDAVEAAEAIARKATRKPGMSTQSADPRVTKALEGCSAARAELDEVRQARPKDGDEDEAWQARAGEAAERARAAARELRDAIEASPTEGAGGSPSP